MTDGYIKCKIYPEGFGLFAGLEYGVELDVGEEYPLIAWVQKKNNFIDVNEDKMEGKVRVCIDRQLEDGVRVFFPHGSLNGPSSFVVDSSRIEYPAA